MSTNRLRTKTTQSESASTDFQSIDFDGFFQAHWSRVYGVIYRLVGDHAEAEDLALEVFWRLHQHPPRRIDNHLGWLYRVATNLGLNALRARRRRQQYETEAGQVTLNGASPADPGAALAREGERRRVRQVLAQMKARSARILVLRHSGLSYAEVAVATGISPSSVGTLLSRAEREFEKRYRELA